MSSPMARKRARLDSDQSDKGKRPRHRESTDQEASQIKSNHPPITSPLGCVTPIPAIAGVGGKINCLHAIYFHPVRNEDDYHNPTVCFSPLFVHHFFGLKEEVHGFSELLIRIFYTVDTFEVYVKVEATRAGVITPAPTENSSIVSSLSGVGSEMAESEEDSQIQLRVLSYLSKIPYPRDFHRSESSFLQAIHSPMRTQFTPPGTCVAHLVGTHGLDIRLFECRFDDSTRVGQEFSRYHRRVEWFLHFFIDACSNIDHDHRWTVLLPFVCPSKDSSTSRTTIASSPQAVRKRKSSSSIPSGANSPKASPKVGASRKSKLSSVISSPWSGYELVGLVTLYHFFALPLCRRRVSQFLVFPHFQGRNVGLQLLEWVFQQAVEDPDVAEITVEDPAMSFGQLRDIVGFKIALRKGVLKPEDFFPDGASLVKGEESPKVRKLRHSQAEGKTAPTGKKSQKSPAHSATVGFIGDSEFKKRLKVATKESPHQLVRLTEILSLAKIFPHPLPPPPTTSTPSNSLTQGAIGNEASRTGGHGAARVGMKEITRDWRQMTHQHDHGVGQGGIHHVKPHPSLLASLDTTGTSDFHTSEAMKEIRVKIKKRIRLDHLEDFGTLSANEQRVNLSNTWNDVYMSYYRTVRKIRGAILRHEFV